MCVWVYMCRKTLVNTENCTKCVCCDFDSPLAFPKSKWRANLASTLKRERQRGRKGAYNNANKYACVMDVKIGMVVSENDGNHYVKLICRRNACWILKSNVYILCAYPTELSQRIKKITHNTAKRDCEQNILLDIHSTLVGTLSICPSLLCHLHMVSEEATKRVRSIFYSMILFFRFVFFVSFRLTIIPHLHDPHIRNS